MVWIPVVRGRRADIYERDIDRICWTMTEYEDAMLLREALALGKGAVRLERSHFASRKGGRVER